MLAVPEFMLQQFNGTSDRVALKLHDASIKGDPAVHGGEEAERAFASDVGGLDRGAVLEDGQQRQDGTLRKVGVLVETSGISDLIAELENDRLEMWT